MATSPQFLARLKPESRLLLLFGLVLGGLALLVAPPLSTCDGPSHFYRSVQIQRGEWRAERFSDVSMGGDVPARYAHFVDTLWGDYWSRHEFGTPSSWWKLSAEAARLQGREQVDYANTALYSPANYLFQSAGIGVVSFFGRTPLLEHDVGCLFNLAGYLLLMVLVLERLPRFERGVLLFATNPLMLLQAASLSADAITFAVPLLVVACVLRLRTDGGNCTRAALLLLFGLALFCALLKPTAIIGLFCLLAIPTTCFGSLPRRGLALGLVAAAVAAIWYAWNEPNLSFDIGRWTNPNASPRALMQQWFRLHPMAFAPVAGRFLSTWWWVHLPGSFGNVGGWVPSWVYTALPTAAFAYGGAILVVDTGGSRRDCGWALTIGLQGFLTVVGLALTLWLSLGSPGTPDVPSVGGRYLLPAYFATSFCLAELLSGWMARIRRLFSFGGLAVNAAFLLLLLGAVAAHML